MARGKVPAAPKGESMSNGAAPDQARLAQARRLVEEIESGHEEQADQVLDELTRMRESNLFRQLGKLTRELHETLNSFRLDSRLSTLAERDIPDAKERLNYVVTLTEQSAHRTLSAVEESLPAAEVLGRDAVELGGQWRRFRQRELSADEFRELARRLDGFFERTGLDAERLRGNLSEVLMAQEFQDLSGQVIRRVIHLVQEVEESLVQLLRITGAQLLGASELLPEEESEAGYGPAVPGVDTNEVLSGQDEVDDLLSSLGF